MTVANPGADERFALRQSVGVVDQLTTGLRELADGIARRDRELHGESGSEIQRYCEQVRELAADIELADERTYPRDCRCGASIRSPGDYMSHLFYTINEVGKHTLVPLSKEDLSRKGKLRRTLAS